MTGTAVFTGAGASKAFGLPLTDELLPLISERLQSGQLFGGSQEEREQFSTCLDVLLPGFRHAKRTALPLLTDLLSLVDHSLTSRNSLAPVVTARALAEFRNLLERAILEVLMISGQPLVPAPLTAFARWLMAQAAKDAIGLISTNYDIQLESEIFRGHDRHFISTHFDFGFSWRDVFTGKVYTRPAEPFFRVYKLHGSFNWLRCELCDHVYINTYGSIADLSYERISRGNTCHCNYAPLRSLLIAPSIIRDIRDVNLLECWRSAIEFLRTAQEWIIIGYSFPPEDIAIRSLFLRAYHARETPPVIRVIQMGSGLLERYRLFFPNCLYEPGGLEEFLTQVGSPPSV